MKVIIVHYHLNPGGVTKIIESQIRGIKNATLIQNILVICGNANSLTTISGADVVEEADLFYTGNELSDPLFHGKVSSILKAIRSHLTTDAVLHCHNPNLGKNPALTVALFKLASEGVPVINHCHDFAEDRPANMALLNKTLPRLTPNTLNQVFYPDFERYHFIVLNSCDLRRILQQGIAPSKVHLVPNPVQMQKITDNNEIPDLKTKIYTKLGLDKIKKLCTYPVRAITRKNLGEFVLFAALFSDEAHFVVTLPPRNPLELPQYNQWKTFCLDYKINIVFEAGEAVDYEQLINISDFCITTSVREGFGMIYTEPWLAGTPVIGRSLDCIIDDLKHEGMEFPYLYKKLNVYKHNKLFDFKDLDNVDQEEIIIHVIQNEHARKELVKDNPFLSGFIHDFPDEIIKKNQQIIQKRFSIEEYGRELLAIYRRISE